MPAASPPITVALLALPDSTAATLYGFYDLLAGVRRDWSLLHGGTPVASPFRPLVVSEDGAPLDLSNGVRITPHASYASCPRPDLAVVCDLAVAPGASGAGFDAAVRWLRDCHAAGAVLASACSGALLLARTGLLDGLDATSHWAYCDALRRAHPATRWHPDRGLVAAGPGQRLLMAGSGMSWHLLALAIAARYAGPEDAMRVARINLMDLQAATPLAYASLTHGSRAADPVIARCQDWAALHYAGEAPVAHMARMSQLAERTFKRRFAAATGMTPLDYVHHVRLEEAKQLLETDDTVPVEAVAVDVGYSDASFFSRLFRRKVGMSPAQYRRRFGRLARRLSALAGPAGAPGPDPAAATRAPPAGRPRGARAPRPPSAPASTAP